MFFNHLNRRKTTPAPAAVTPSQLAASVTQLPIPNNVHKNGGIVVPKAQTGVPAFVSQTKPYIAPSYISPLLRFILEVRRPTKDEAFCHKFMTDLLDTMEIHYFSDLYHNVTVVIGHEPTTCFTAHHDTVHNDYGVNELLINGTMVTVKGNGVLGADDGTGIYIMLRMILSKVPGRYVFFSGEEKGRLGSKKYAMPQKIVRCISFDRKGTTSIITHQSGQRCCSNEFAEAFIKEFDLPFKKDDGGSFTDSYTFIDSIPECTNLSVGYYSQHSNLESQDLAFVEKMVAACLNMKWDELPAVRDPKEVEDEWAYPSYSGYGYGHGGWARKSKNKQHCTPPVSQKTVNFTSDIEEFCYDNYDVVAYILEEYGVTATMCKEFKKEYDFLYFPKG